MKLIFQKTFVSQAISETELEIANIKTENLNEILKELQEVQTKIADLKERIRFNFKRCSNQNVNNSACIRNN